jgi:hypothetical protein
MTSGYLLTKRTLRKIHGSLHYPATDRHPASPTRLIFNSTAIRYLPTQFLVHDVPFKLMSSSVILNPEDARELGLVVGDRVSVTVGEEPCIPGRCLRSSRGLYASTLSFFPRGPSGVPALFRCHS